LSRALSDSDPAQTRKALLLWHPIINLSSKTSRLDQLPLNDEQLEAELLKLDAAIYSISASSVVNYSLIKTRLSLLRKEIFRRNSGRISALSDDAKTPGLYPARMQP